jgi:hypothetical protein
MERGNRKKLLSSPSSKTLESKQRLKGLRRGGGGGREGGSQAVWPSGRRTTLRKDNMTTDNILIALINAASYIGSDHRILMHLDLVPYGANQCSPTWRPPHVNPLLCGLYRGGSAR